MVDIDEINKRLADYKEEQNKRTKINKVLDELYNLVTTSQSNAYIWGQMYDMAQKRPEILELMGMLVFTASALLIEKMTLDVAKFFDKSSNAINHQYLVNLINNEGKLTIERSKLLQLQSCVSNGTLELNKHSDLVNKLKFNRDKKIAHLDKSQLSAEFDITTMIEVEEIRTILDELEKIYLQCYSICGYKQPTTSAAHIQSLEGFGMSTTFDNLYHVLDTGLDNLVKNEQNSLIQSVMFGKEIRNWLNE